MTTADQVFKTLLSSIKNETGVEPTDIKPTYDELTTLRFTVEQPLGLLARLTRQPISGRFEPKAGDQPLVDGVSLAQASEATQQEALQSAHAALLKTVQGGQLPARGQGNYQRFSARFWHLDLCPTCAGMGGGPCQSCFGEQTFTCNRCHGSAVVDCGCNHGRVQCTRCYGVGTRTEQAWEYRTVKITQHDAPARFESHRFDFEKKVPCGCEAGWIRCTSCRGSGTLNCPAAVCLGGRTPCATCMGSGDAPPCKPCDGSGQTGTLHEGAVHLDWGTPRVVLPTKMSDVENLVRRTLGSDSRLLGESTTTFKTVASTDTAESPYSLVVTQDARLKIIRVDVDWSGKTYQVIGYGSQPSLAADGGLQSLMAAPIRQERAAAHNKAKLADTINRQALMSAINALAQTQGKPPANSADVRSALKTSMQSVYFKEEVNWLLSEPIQSERYFSGARLGHGDDHHRFRTSFIDSVERIFVSLKRRYINTALLCVAFVVGMGTWLGSPLMAGVIGLFMTPIGLHNRFFRKLLFRQFQGIFDCPEKTITSFRRLLCSESVFSSFAQENRRQFAEPGLSLRIRGLFLIVITGLAVLTAQHGLAGALAQVKAWGFTALHWFA